MKLPTLPQIKSFVLQHKKPIGIGMLSLAGLALLLKGAKPMGKIALTHDNKIRMLTFVSQFEGKYTSLNKDWEFEGVFDDPRKDKNGNPIPKEERQYHEGFDPHSASRFGQSPRHVGLSFGFIQFTQASGGLGKVMKGFYNRNPKAFASIFGPSHMEMLNRVTAKDTSAVPYGGVPVPDARANVGWAKRDNRTHPVDGADLWQEPWASRFIKAGEHPDCQKAQIEEALSYYMNGAIRNNKEFGLYSEKALLFMLDRVVKSGANGARSHVKKYMPTTGSDEERITAYYNKCKNDGFAHRTKKILAASDFSFDKVLDLG